MKLLQDWLAAGSLLLLGGCRAVEVSSLNLDALHGPQGRHQRIVDLTGTLEYRIRQLLSRTPLKGASIGGGEPRAIGNPEKECLEALLTLASFNPNQGLVVSTQVQHFAYLAVSDPWSLSRERAMDELGLIAARMELGDPRRFQAARAGETASPPELAEAVAGLAEVVPPVLGAGELANETQKADFRAAIELLSEMEFDLEGGRRLLKVIASLLSKPRSARPLFDPLRELRDRVHVELVGQALARGLFDEEQRVRAAAFRANWQAYGDAFLGEALQSLVDRSNSEEERAQRVFGLEEQWAGDDEVFVTVFDIVRENGLPKDATGADATAGRKRLSYMLVMCQVAFDFGSYDARARTSAMRALGAVSEAGFESLRFEDWDAWWSVHSETELTRIGALEAAAGGSVESGDGARP